MSDQQRNPRRRIEFKIRTQGCDENPMCNDYEQHIRYAEYCKVMQNLELGIPEHQSEPVALLDGRIDRIHVDMDDFRTEIELISFMVASVSCFGVTSALNK
jgi:hypothetical protein